VCDGSVCVPQASGSDLKEECAAGECQPGHCDGASSCEFLPLGTDCGTCAVCDGSGSCSVYDDTQDADCNDFDLPAVATCDFTPDGDPDTWDTHAAVNSECVAVGSCSKDLVSDLPNPLLGGVLLLHASFFFRSQNPLLDHASIWSKLS
jgi:hypothetical protein